MANQWPTDIPFCLLMQGYLEERQPVVIRSPVDSGPQKVRRRYTRPLNGIIGALVVTLEQLDSFWLFFDTTLQGGTFTFEVPNQITGEMKECRFLQPPRISAINEDKYNLEVVIEEL